MVQIPPAPPKLSRLLRPRWLAICSVRTLAGLLAGPGAGERFDQLSVGVHALAPQTGADDLVVVANMEVMLCAEAYERGAMLRVDEITRGSQFLRPATTPPLVPSSPDRSSPAWR
jgi:hypothetical protein